MYTYEYRVHRNQKRADIRSTKLELQMVGRSSAWVLGTKLRSSARAVFAFNYRVMSPAPGFTFFVCKLKACNFPFVPWLENNCTIFLSLTSVQIFPKCLLCWREVKLNTSHTVSTVKEFPFSRKRERKKTTQTELKTVHKIFS